MTHEFGYNGRSELASAEMGTHDYGYGYDPIGNRRVATNDAEVLTYLSNELNQYTNVADGVTLEPTYDADGNMLTYGGWTLGWNGENRLVLASNGATRATFAYDSMGRRFLKAVGATTNRYTYDGWAMIREADGSRTNDYAYGLDLSGSSQGAGTIGGLLMATLDGTNAFYCYDANGNVTELVDGGGNTVAAYRYDPFGNTIGKSGTLADANPFRFSTKYLDGETDLYYYGLRFYSPKLGRWVSRDPVGELADRGLYIFAANAPTLRIDLLGAMATPPPGGAGVWEAINGVGPVGVPDGVFGYSFVTAWKFSGIPPVWAKQEWLLTEARLLEARGWDRTRRKCVHIQPGPYRWTLDALTIAVGVFSPDEDNTEYGDKARFSWCHWRQEVVKTTGFSPSPASGVVLPPLLPDQDLTQMDYNQRLAQLSGTMLQNRFEYTWDDPDGEACCNCCSQGECYIGTGAYESLTSYVEVAPKTWGGPF